MLLPLLHILLFLHFPPDFPQKFIFVDEPIGFSLVTKLKAGRKKIVLSQNSVLYIFKKTKNLTGELLSILG